MTDEEVASLVQQGNTDKYEEIVKRFERPLVSYIGKTINQSYEEVEDLVQEVLIKGFVNIQSFDIKKKFSSWIFRIAHNQCVDYFRKKRFKSVDIESKEEWLENKEKLIEDLEIEEEKIRELTRAIESLDPNHKEILVLYYFEAKSYEEISDILHTPVSNVGVILFRAKLRLKKLLTYYED